MPRVRAAINFGDGGQRRVATPKTGVTAEAADVQ